jgi:hypothetical protein
MKSKLTKLSLLAHTGIHATVTAMLITCIGITAAKSGAATLYEQTFFNDTAGTKTVQGASIGWYVYQGSTATNQTNNNTLWYVDNQNGFGGQKGFLRRLAENSTFKSTTSLAFTETTLAVDSIESFSVVFRTTGTPAENDVLRFAIRIEDQWYVSTTPVSLEKNGTNTGDWSKATPAVVDFVTTASSWRQLTFTAGQSLVLTDQTATAALSGTITGVGLFFPGGASVGQFIDNFQVNETTTPVPEPGVLVLVCGLGAFGCAICVRRRHR